MSAPSYAGEVSYAEIKQQTAIRTRGGTDEIVSATTIYR
jgi:hypothetical protein